MNTQAFPGTSDDRTAEDVDRHIKEANAVLPPLLTDEQILRAIHSIGQDGWGRIALTYESGPYDIDKPTNVAIRLARTIESEVRLALAAAGGGVPQGWKLVPVEPTWDMKIAASSNYREPRDGHYTARMECAADAYRAMLASSPQPEAAPAVAQAVREHPPCKGMNCGITRTDQEHSLECQAEHAAAIAGGRFVKGEAAPAVAQVPQCRSDGRCQYAIDHGAEGLGHCPPGKCAMPAAPEAPAQANNLTAELQQRCSDWGVYWRAPDAHGVVLTVDQATELLRDALGVEVEVKAPAQRCPYCDDTGDVHTPTGEWRGRCTCPAGTEAPAQANACCGNWAAGTSCFADPKVDCPRLLPIREAPVQAAPSAGEVEQRVREFERLLEHLIDIDPDRAERFIESTLAHLALKKRLEEKRAALSHKEQP